MNASPGGKSRKFILGHVRVGKDVLQKEVVDAGICFVAKAKVPTFQENYLLRFARSSDEVGSSLAATETPIWKQKMIEAVVFDLDGLMIDSQPYWQTAQLEILPHLGVPITRQDTIDTTGMRIDHIVQMCYDKSPWDSVSVEEVCNRILNRVTELVQEHKPAMPGLNHAIEVCQRQGLKLAVASSSPMTLIDATIKALRLDDVFIEKSSGEHLRYGKPHPEVYLNACDALSVGPQRCVAIEDSFVGLLAAKAAQMKTVVIPEPSMANQKHFAIADRQLHSLEELTPDILHSL